MKWYECGGWIPFALLLYFIGMLALPEIGMHVFGW